MTEIARMRVGKDTSVRKLADAIRYAAEKDGISQMEVFSIGAKATNQAIKAIADARQWCIKSGGTFSVFPDFDRIKLGDTEMTAIKHVIEVKGPFKEVEEGFTETVVEA